MMLWADHAANMCCSQPWLVKCHYCMPHHRCYFCTYIIYTSKREGRTVGGRVKRGKAMSYREHTSNWFDHVGRRIQRYEGWGGGGVCVHATVGFDGYMLRCPYNMLIDSRKTPPLLCSQGKYRRNRNKAESLSTLEVHWSKTMAWLFINQLSLAKCLLRWRAKACGTLQHQPQDSKTVDIQ